MTLPLHLRASSPEDNAFIYSSWLHSYRNGCGWMKLIDPKVYYRTQHELIFRILTKPSTEIAVAYDPDYPLVIIGYAVFSGPTTLDYVYVKEAFRRMGIMRLLIEQLPAIDTVTHQTARFRSIIEKSQEAFRNLRFCPYSPPGTKAAR